MTQSETYLTTRDVARRYGVNEDTARRWLRTRRIPSFRFGTSKYVRLSDLETMEATMVGGLPAAEPLSTGRPGRPSTPLRPVAPEPEPEPEPELEPERTWEYPWRACLCGARMRLNEIADHDCGVVTEPRL